MKKVLKQFFKNMNDTWYAAMTACLAVRIYKDAWDNNDLVWIIGGWLCMMLAFCMVINKVDDRYCNRIDKLEETVKRLEDKEND
jgi:hypothetical protein